MKVLTCISLLLFSLTFAFSHAEARPDAEQLALDFFSSGNYHLLADSEKEIIPESAWDENLVARYNRIGVALSPIRRHYELEQYLVGLCSFTTSSEPRRNGVTTVKIQYNCPEVFFGLGYSVSWDHEFFEKYPDRLNDLFKRGVLQDSELEREEREYEVEVSATGVVVGAQGIMDSMERRSQIAALGEKISHIENYNLIDIIHGTWFRDRDGSKAIAKARAIGLEQIQLDIDTVRSVIIDKQSYSEGNDHFTTELYRLERLLSVQEILKADRIFSTSLVFENARTGNSDLGRLGAFFDWKLTSDSLPAEEYRAHYAVRYFDGETLLGTETTNTAISTKGSTRVGRMGTPINNERAEELSDSIRISYLFPKGVVRFSCDFDEVSIDCQRP